MSNMKLPFEKMNGGCASHLGINPGYFKAETFEEKGVEFQKKIMNPLFTIHRRKAFHHSISMSM